MAEQGFAVLVLDHAPFGETSPMKDKSDMGMSLLMGMGDVLGVSQLGLRAAETMRAGEYLRARADVDENRVAISGLCQGGMDTWLVAALDERFCAAAPLCAATTFEIHMVEMASYFANADSSPFPFRNSKRLRHSTLARGDCTAPSVGAGQPGRPVVAYERV